MKVRMHQIANSARCSITMVTSKILCNLFGVQAKFLNPLDNLTFSDLRVIKSLCHETKDHLIKFLYEKKFLREEI